MVILLTLVHIIVCLFLIIVVLLQSGKAADLAGAFGGMGSQTAFGARGAATVLTKATTVAAALFMVTSLSLSILATRQQGGGTTVLENVKSSAPKQTEKKTDPGKGSSITLTPEGAGPGQSVTVPLPPAPQAEAPKPESKKK